MARGLPPDVERAARLSAIPPHLRSAFALLPAPLELRVTLPDGDDPELPIAACQLIKLALLGAGAILLGVEQGPALSMEVALRERKQVLAEADLARELPALLPTLLLSLSDRMSGESKSGESKSGGH